VNKPKHNRKPKPTDKANLIDVALVISNPNASYQDLLDLFQPEKKSRRSP
jgi:hypothetical protein